MSNGYSFLLLIFPLVLSDSTVLSQEKNYTVCPADEHICIVDWADSTGTPIADALPNTILNDSSRTAGRIYQLKRGGIYILEFESITNPDFHLRLIGEPNETDSLPPPIIQSTNGEASSYPLILSAYKNLTLKNLWFTGQTTDGNTGGYLPIRIFGEGSRITIDNVILERSDYALIGVDAPNTKFYITNSSFRNYTNKTQQWEGRGIRFESGADTLMIENNTFLNIGMSIIQSEAAPINYTLFVHNTVINTGRLFNAGNFWRYGFIANNLFINHFWHGEGYTDIAFDLTPETEYSGFFRISPIGAGAGFSDWTRRIVYTKNAHWRDPQFAEYYADTINAQPVFNSEADSMFNTFNAENGSGSMYRENNLEGIDPELYSYYTAPDLSDFPETEISLQNLVPKQIDNIRDLRENRRSPLTDYTWDPGRNPNYYSADGFVWPLPENFSYSNAELMNAGTDGLPLGNLNWQDPDYLQDWTSNRWRYISEIENLAGIIDEPPVFESRIEAETGTLSGDATIFTYDGFAEFRVESFGFAEWEFELTESVQIDELNFKIRSNDQIRGINFYVDGQRISNSSDSSWGEIRFYNLEANTYPEKGNAITVDTVPSYSKEALELGPGLHKVQWEPGWGYYTFNGVELKSDGEVVADLQVTNSTDSQFFEVLGPDSVWIPQKFGAVDLGEKGSFEILIDSLPEPDCRNFFFFEIFYENSGSENKPELVVNENVLGTSDDFFETSPNSTSKLRTFHFEIPENTPIQLSLSGSYARVDYLQLYREISSHCGPISTETTSKVDQFKLSQNYPNPFNPSTTIDFQLPATGDVQLTVYNLLGQKVATLVDTRLNNGNHSVRFDAMNLSSGVYFYILKTGNFTDKKKMLLIK